MAKKILIIDDDSRNIFALSAVLKAKGFSCVSAASAREGIDMLKDDQEKEIGIILLDMMMPEMDGYEALQEIKALRQDESMPVISVTAQAMTGDREKCMAAGADEYVSKPVDADVLIAMLHRYIG